MSSSHSIILASSSPRRQALMHALGYPCTIVKPNIAEGYPPKLPVAHVPTYLAKKKALAVQRKLSNNTIIIAADTVVTLHGKTFNKPTDRKAALEMLASLSDREHTVITGVCIRDKRGTHCFSDRAKVKFRALKPLEMRHYVDHCKPYDKAGGYGIQEWIGLIGVESIQGAYTTIMGLPTHKVYAHIEGLSTKALPDTDL